MNPAPVGEDDPELGLYGITVAAELVGAGVQNLRLEARVQDLESEAGLHGRRRR